jgi:hypothetical protein
MRHLRLLVYSRLARLPAILRETPRSVAFADGLTAISVYRRKYRRTLMSIKKYNVAISIPKILPA